MRIGVRNDVYNLLSVTLKCVVFVGSLVVAYRVTIRLVYLIRNHLDKSWERMDRERDQKHFNDNLYQDQPQLRTLNARPTILKPFKG